jgi:MFS family permease
MLCLVGGIGMALGRNLPVLLVSRVLMGFGFSAYVTAAMAYQALVVSEESRGAAFALTTAGSMAPQATAVPLAEWMLRRGWDGIYLWTAVLLAGAAGVLGARIAPGGERLAVHRNRGGEEGAGKPRVWGTYGELFRSRGIRILLAAVLVTSLLDAMTIVTPYLARERGLSVSFFMVGSSVVAVLLRTLGFRLLDWFPRPKVVAPAFGTMALATLAAAFVPSNSMLLLCGCLFGLGIGAGFPCLVSLVGDLFPEGLRPKGTASVLLVYDLGWTLTPLLYGLAVPLMGTRGTFLAAGLSGLVAAIFLNRSLRRLAIR